MLILERKTLCPRASRKNS